MIYSLFINLYYVKLMSKKYKKTKESSLSTKHKALLKTFLKDLINDLADGKLNRESLINKVNQKFKDYNLKPIYTKTKLSNSIANYRYNAKHLKNRNLNIKIPESSFKKKVVKEEVVKEEAVKEEVVKEEAVKEEAVKQEVVKVLS